MLHDASSSPAAAPLTTLSTHARVSAVLTPDVYLGRLRLVCPCRVNQSLLNIRCKRVKGLVDVNVALGRDLEKGDAEFVGERLALFCRDGALLLPVALVANENLVNAFGGMLLDVGEPCADVWRSIISPCRPPLVRARVNLLLKLFSSVTS